MGPKFVPITGPKHLTKLSGRPASAGYCDRVRGCRALEISRSVASWAFPAAADCAVTFGLRQGALPSGLARGTEPVLAGASAFGQGEGTARHQLFERRTKLSRRHFDDRTASGAHCMVVRFRLQPVRSDTALNGQRVQQAPGRRE